MWETTTVQLSVRLPKDIAAQAEEVQKTDPEFLSRVILYGLTRRSIYKHLRDTQEQVIADMKKHVFDDDVTADRA